MPAAQQNGEDAERAHRADDPKRYCAGVISALVALPFAEPANVTWRQVPWLLALSPGQLAGGERGPLERR